MAAKKNELTNEERAMLKQSLAPHVSSFVNDELLDFFWSPFESLSKTKGQTFEPSERAALKKRIARSGTYQRQSYAIFAIIALVIFVLSYPYWVIGLMIDVVLIYLWAHATSKLFKVNLTSYDKFVLLDTYNEKMNQWNYEYLQLRENLFVALRDKNEITKEQYLRELCRYLKMGIVVLDRPRLLDKDPFISM